MGAFPLFHTLQRHRADLLVLVLMVAGLLLNIYAPIWFTPPLFYYTVWLYLLLFFAWIPAYLLLLRTGRRPALMALTVIVSGLLLTCLCLTIRPRSAFGLTILESITCQAQTPAETGRVRYACTRSSLDGPDFNRTFLFDTLPGLPIMWLVEGDF
jgi:hypothetical protein